MFQDGQVHAADTFDGLAGKCQNTFVTRILFICVVRVARINRFKTNRTIFSGNTRYLGIVSNRPSKPFEIPHHRLNQCRQTLRAPDESGHRFHFMFKYTERLVGTGRMNLGPIREHLVKMLRLHNAKNILKKLAKSMRLKNGRRQGAKRCEIAAAELGEVVFRARPVHKKRIPRHGIGMKTVPFQEPKYTFMR